jgi:chitin disaccharide deacetylase
MKCLIVNGDDFGASRGVNRGIVEAHCRGILTSTSLMVGRPFAAEAARWSRDLPQLSVGLHIDLRDEDPGRCAAELRRQLDRFHELVGCLPTHLDSHHDAHRHPRLLPHFLALARQHGLPLRGHSPARCFSQFYGRWDGASHPEQVSVASLVRMLRAEVREGYTELTCHPGYPDPDFPTSYSGEREAELSTLCDARVREALAEQQIRLIGFRDLAGPPTGAAT